MGYRIYNKKRHETGKTTSCRKRVMGQMRELAKLFIAYKDIEGVPKNAYASCDAVSELSRPWKKIIIIIIIIIIIKNENNNNKIKIIKIIIKIKTRIRYFIKFNCYIMYSTHVYVSNPNSA